MKILASSILVFHVFISFAAGNVFEINRNRPPGILPWRNSRDSFKMPISTCNRTSASDVCGTFDAADGDQSCTCSCPSNKATFVFDDDEWRCLDNGEVRRKLQGKRVVVLTTKDRKRKVLAMMQQFYNTFMLW